MSDQQPSPPATPTSAAPTSTPPQDPGNSQANKSFLLRLVRVIVGIVDARVGKRVSPLEEKVKQLTASPPAATAPAAPSDLQPLRTAMSEMEQKMAVLRVDITSLADNRVSPSGLQAAFEEFVREEEGRVGGTPST